MHIRRISTLAVLSLSALGANAEGLRVEKNMSLELASKIAAPRSPPVAPTNTT